jgi:hypothetical protein
VVVDWKGAYVFALPETRVIERRWSIVVKKLLDPQTAITARELRAMRGAV